MHSKSETMPTASTSLGVKMSFYSGNTVREKHTPPRPSAWKRAGVATALFTTAAHLGNTLIEAREERQLKRYLARLSRFELLIIDEVGYIPFSSEGAQLLFQVFYDRY